MSIYKKMVKRFGILFFILGFLLNRGTEVSAQEKVYIIGTDTTYAPFEYVDEEGDFVGIDMDLLEAIAEDQGFEYELRILGFNAAVQALESNQVDGVIAGMSITDERKEAFDFTDPYYSSGSQFAVLEDSEVDSLEDLEGKIVAVKTGTTGFDVATELSEEYGFTLNVFEDSVNMYEDMQVGNSVAVVEDYPVMLYAHSTGRIRLKFIGEQQAVADNGLAVNKGENQELLQMFNDGLANLRASGEYEEIIARYLGEEALEEENKNQNIIVQFINNLEPLMEGLWQTIWLSFVSFFIALIFGVIIGLMRTSDVSLLNILAQIYIDIMRGSPLIVLAFFIYFGIPQMTGLKFNANIAGIITLSLNATAYIAEIVRGGIQAVNKGQVEAGKSLGLTNSITMRRIILPQASKIAMPSLINQFVITLKDTSILSVIGIVELTQTGKIIIARTYQSGSIWLIIGAMYIILITVLTKLSNRLEKEL
ncbi:polar amino acid transport system substrate-binding protein [Atopostipes suicloacalis DSM 15692]|uniref:Polar amino acid transport system substrate-binding protein n=1 Tax=Atopostipes suicloacalis DSM 15692 TaxID=1121025 RepID=A0A1M4WEL8_9LACT|nr:polar amino acid transport system substrate-binding protein [Atopostipes suicloacalis DSM 15692]